MRWRALLGSSAVVALCAAAPARATLPLEGSQLQASTVGTTANDPTREAKDPQVAYNNVNQEYLVVWSADHTTNEDFEIFGRRVSASGVPLGADFRISFATATGFPDRDAFKPSVAYDSFLNRYLVVWHDDRSSDEDYEISGQIVTAAGTLEGPNRVLSNTAPALGGTRSALNPSVVYRPDPSPTVPGSFFAVWGAEGLATDDEVEIFGQRLAASGDLMGSVQRISTAGQDGAADIAAVEPTVAYASASDRYLVVWNDDRLANERQAIFGQFVRGTDGVPLLADDAQISTPALTSADQVDRDAYAPAAAYDSVTEQFLVVWYADHLATDDEFEVFGHLFLGSDGPAPGPDIRISTTGADGDYTRSASGAAVSYSPLSQEYLVVWSADGLAASGDYEIFGQRADAGGAEIGADFRISTTGVDGDIAAHRAETPAVTSSGDAGEHLALWRGDDVFASDFEIFGRRLNAMGTSVVGPGSDPPAQDPPVQNPAPQDTGAPDAALPGTNAIEVTAAAASQAAAAAPRIDDDPVRMTQDGRVPIELSCPAGGPTCRGEVVLQTVQAFAARVLASASQRQRPRTRRVILGRTSYTIPAGRRMTASVRLSPRNRALLRRLGSVRTRVTVTPRGGGRPRSRTITVRAPRRSARARR